MHDYHWNQGPFDVFCRHQLHGNGDHGLHPDAGCVMDEKKRTAPLIEKEVLELHGIKHRNDRHRLV